LEVLSKLANMKSQPPIKGSLLTFVAQEYIQRICGFDDDLEEEIGFHFPYYMSEIEDAAKISIGQIESEIKAIAADMEILQKEAREGLPFLREHAPDVVYPLERTLNAFFPVAQSELKSLQNYYTSTLTECDQLLVRYCSNDYYAIFLRD
jgi:hypothetical protein